MASFKKIKIVTIGILIFIALRYASEQYGYDKDFVLQVFRDLEEKLGFWAIPLYVLTHTITLSLCLPSAIFLEAGASLLFGFFTAVICVFSAKVLGASLSFWIGRTIFRSSTTAREWAQRHNYYHVLSRGVERDGWRFVLLARFSPIPSYVINYALAATNVNFLIDFLLPTVIGCIPMILQNISVISLAGAAVKSASYPQNSQVTSYLFPMLGILSSVLISLRISKYSSEVVITSPDPSDRTENGELKKTL